MNIQINRADVKPRTIPFNFQIRITSLIYPIRFRNASSQFHREMSLFPCAFSHFTSLKRPDQMLTNDPSRRPDADVSRPRSDESRTKSRKEFQPRASDNVCRMALFRFLGRIFTPDTQIGSLLRVLVSLYYSPTVNEHSVEKRTSASLSRGSSFTLSTVK